MSEELTNQPQNNEVTNPAENNDANTQKEADKNLENTTVETKETEKTNDYSDVNTAEQASAVLESKGFDYEALTEEFQANGDLLPETRTKLAAQGITGEILDTYIEGQKAIIQTSAAEKRNTTFFFRQAIPQIKNILFSTCFTATGKIRTE